MVRNPAANIGDACLIPGLERSPGEGNGNPLQCSSWEIPWTKECGGYSPLGRREAGHNPVTEAAKNNTAAVIESCCIMSVILTF